MSRTLDSCRIYCRNCNSLNPPDTRICYGCGKAIDKDSGDFIYIETPLNEHGVAFPIDYDGYIKHVLEREEEMTKEDGLLTKIGSLSRRVRRRKW